LVSDDKTKGVIVKLSCETDFVAKNEDFITLTRTFAETALKHFPASKDDLLKLPFSDKLNIGEKIIEYLGVIGEKVELADYERIEAAMVAPYIHMGNKAGVIVGLNKASDSFYDPGRDVAMQVAAMHPVAVDKDGVDETVINKEIEIGMEVARNEGKPEALLEKIARGKLNKFFKEKTLLNQQFVKNNKETVAGYLQSLDGDLTVTDFKHVTLG